MVRARAAHPVFALILIVSSVAGLAAAPLSRTNSARARQASSGQSLIDINRASAEELKTLPGIADAYASSIARHRPYQNKAQLLSRGVIPVATYKRIKDKIIARQ